MGDVIDYLCENGLEPDKIDDISFYEKEYGFFRGYMDAGISNNIIIKVIRAMYQFRVHDSRDLDLKVILSPKEFSIIQDYASYDPIYLPWAIDILELRNMSPFYLCGGSSDACLLEIELLCNALNIKYKKISNLIYK